MTDDTKSRWNTLDAEQKHAVMADRGLFKHVDIDGEPVPLVDLLPPEQAWRERLRTRLEELCAVNDGEDPCESALNEIERLEATLDRVMGVLGRETVECRRWRLMHSELVDLLEGECTTNDISATIISYAPEYKR